MKLKLHVWRQADANTEGRFVSYDLDGVKKTMSFLEMLDLLNQKLIADGDDPVAFDHDCREGICGSCSLVINGSAHGPQEGTTSCQLHMRAFNDGDEIYVEPWRAAAFPVIKDLVTNREAFDRIIQAGGFISVNTGGVPDANATLISKSAADSAMDSAACIGCGACVAACKNASAMLFVSAKVAHLGSLPQGEPEKNKRALAMVRQMDKEGFGHCSNTLECGAACPKEISTDNIANLNRDYIRASLFSREKS